ncbi:hypothetical protein KFZ70_11770 [Tamlana fucoidanivorans]|uniref:Nuclear transport factor 2 family protein n=1 Tax=Allotamlana fucoidanivorans TaxID=2583814 RepID=A0A5C4SIZ3_9FLAO|nr:hypothetical protein [Tamlana fucoidanivorans]TNJ43054.1 hypothetical protein FGF67_11870 [Tamlana fucoidanivorans]
MKHGCFFLLAYFCLLSLYGQNVSQTPPPPAIDSTIVFTIDSTIKELYNSISGEKDVPRNWKQFKFLFRKDAKLIPSGKDKNGKWKTLYMSPDDYIKSSKDWLVSNGFIEREIKRKVERFGNIAQVFSSYECYHNNEEERPFMRGVNSIQLLNDGQRWWIINLFWTHETSETPIPDKYLRATF